MINVARSLGSPKIYVSITPPLMRDSAYGMNQTAINTIFPNLIPLIGKTNRVDGIIDVFGGMGGNREWKSTFPINCTLTSHFTSCKYFGESDQ